MSGYSSVSALLDELVPAVEHEEPAWEDVLLRAEARAATADGNGRSVLASRRRAWPIRRRWLAFALAVAAIAVLFATPAFGLLLDLVGRTNVPFLKSGTAPLEVKRSFFDLSLGAPPGMAPDAIASQARRVAVFRANGKQHILYVAPTRKGGFCEQFTDAFGGCRASRIPLPHFPTFAGAVNSFLLDVSAEGSPFRINPKSGRVVGNPDTYTTLVGGSTFASTAASIEVVYEDHTRTVIPFVYVSKPIDAGFFFYGIPEGHRRPGTRVAAIIVRDKSGRILARQPILYARPRAIPPPTTTAPPPHRVSKPATPSPPFQRGSAQGVTVVVVVGHNGVVNFDISGASAALQPLLRSASYACFRFMRYHQQSPAELGFAPQTIVDDTIRITGLPTPYDGCEIQGSYGHRWPDRNHSHSAVEIAFTPRATRFFADRAAARDLALFLRSRQMQRIRRLSNAPLTAAITRRYGHAITHVPTTHANLAPDRIGYATSGKTTTFFENSTTGRHFVVVVAHGRIVSEKIKPFAFVF
jgi:hypothetical protein